MLNIGQVSEQLNRNTLVNRAYKGTRTDKRTDVRHGGDNSLQPNWLRAKKAF